MVRIVSEAVSRRQQNSILKRVHTINQTIRRKRYVARSPGGTSNVSITSASASPSAPPQVAAYSLPAIPASSASPPSSAGSDDAGITPYQSPSVDEQQAPVAATPAPAVPSPAYGGSGSGGTSNDKLIESQMLASHVERPFADSTSAPAVECLGHQVNIVPATSDSYNSSSCSSINNINNNKDLLTVSLPTASGIESANGSSATSSTSSFSPQLGAALGLGDARSGSDSGTFPSISEGELDADQQMHGAGAARDPEASASRTLSAKSSVPLSPPVFDEKGSCAPPLSAAAFASRASAQTAVPEPATDPRPARPHSTSVPPLPVGASPSAPIATASSNTEPLRASGSQRDKHQQAQAKEKERSKGIANVLDFFLPSKSKGSYSFNKSASLSSADDPSVSGGTSPVPGLVPTLTHVAPIKSTPEHSVSSHKSGTQPLIGCALISFAEPFNLT